MMLRDVLNISIESIFFYRFYQYSLGHHEASTMGKLDQLRSTLYLLIKRQYFLDRWIGDESLLSILHNQYNLHNINKYYLNRYIQNIGLNDVNIFYHQEDYLFGREEKTRRTFFFIFTARNLCPEKLSREEFIKCFNQFRILRSDQSTTTPTNNKRKALMDISTSTNKKDSSSTQQSSILISPETKNKENIQVIEDIGTYFNDTRAKSIFGCDLDENVYDCLSRRIDLFDEVLKNNVPISSIVNKSDKKSQFTPKQMNTTIHRMQYLRLTYLKVLNMDPDKRCSFKMCCELAIEHLKEVGIKFIHSPKYLMKLNRYFRQNNKLPHPNIQVELDRQYRSPFLEMFPEAKIELKEWALKNLSVLNCDVIKKYISQKLFPKVYETYLSEHPNDNSPSLDHFLSDFGLKRNISESTTWRWLTHLGFKFDERKKTYYTDKHESEENRVYRKKFIDEYLQYELYTYVWVQLEESVANIFEKEENLLENMYFEYKENDKIMREYHVDSHEKFSNLQLTLSVRRNPQLRPIIIVGQDESVFKQYSFGRRCWFGPNGEAELIPKTDGYSQMVSAFVSRSFGVGLQLNEEELARVNERRRSERWGHYTEKKAAMEIYGSTKKKMITDKLTLVQFFDLGINEEGYWNYFHMALQIEDAFDVLSINFPEYDFFF